MPRRKGPAHYHIWAILQPGGGTGVLSLGMIAPDNVIGVRSVKTFRHRVQAMREAKLRRRRGVEGVNSWQTAICYDRTCPSPESGERGSHNF